MILQHIKLNLLALIFGTFLAFLIIAAPHAAKAQDVCDPSGDYYTSTSSTLHNVAGRITQVRKDFLDKSPVLHSANYCIDTLINTIENMRTLIQGGDAYHLIFGLVLNAILGAIVNFACSVAQQIIQDITQIGNSILGPLKICLPLPQLHLGLNFPRIPNVCIGSGTPLAQIQLQPMSTPPNAPAQVDMWKIWDSQNAGFINYNPVGP